MAILAVFAGLVILVKGGDWLLQSAVSLSLKLQIPKIVVGMTVVSFATSMPELIVSVQSALSGHPDLAFGNVLGSNIANIAFVLAVVIIIAPINVSNSFYKTDFPMMIFATALFYVFVAFDSKLESYEGAILFSILILFLFYLIKIRKKEESEDELEEDSMSSLSSFYYLVIGGFGLWLGSETLVKGAVALAYDFGVSERIISISIISVGTSIPELSASIIGIIKKQKAISLGNLIGSNIFNILAVMGITSMITPIVVKDQGLLENDIWWMIGISCIILPLVFFPRGNRLGWIDGIILLTLYLIFIIPLIL